MISYLSFQLVIRKKLIISSSYMSETHSWIYISNKIWPLLKYISDWHTEERSTWYIWKVSIVLDHFAEAKRLSSNCHVFLTMHCPSLLKYRHSFLILETWWLKTRPNRIQYVPWEQYLIRTLSKMRESNQIIQKLCKHRQLHEI